VQEQDASAYSAPFRDSVLCFLLIVELAPQGDTRSSLIECESGLADIPRNLKIFKPCRRN